MNTKQHLFSGKSLHDAIRVWERACVYLVDVRHGSLGQEESLECYRLPSSAFIFTYGGRAEVILEEKSYRLERFGLFHGGKGTKVSLWSGCVQLEYYMLYYKWEAPAFHQKEYEYLLGRINPFRQEFGFEPSDPVFFLEQFKKLNDHWKNSQALGKLYGKAALYQMVYEVYQEMEQESISVFQPDIMGMARRYLDEHYMDNVSIKGMASLFGISDSHLRRSFKQQYGNSPQEYLMNIRFNSAKRLLKNQNIPIRNVAYSSGFSDEYNFSRLFYKSFGMPPSEYRANVSTNMSDMNMDSLSSFFYNEKSPVRDDKLNIGGTQAMSQYMKKRFFAAAMFSAMLITACSAADKGALTENTGTVSQQAATGNQTEEETRVIHMSYGDVEIPTNPKRVVVAFFQGDLLALGIHPIGTTFNDDAVFEQELEDITVVDAFDLNPEAVMELEPDLIIWNNTDDYETLSKIAPTLAENYYDMEFEDRITFFGEVFGVPEKAAEVIEEFKDKAAQAKEQLQEAGLSDKTVILLENQTKGALRAFGDNYGRGGEIIYKFLGLKAPERIQKEVIDKSDVYFVDISYEMLHEYVGDYIFSDEKIAELRGVEVWESLPAVKEGRLIQNSSGMFWFSDITSMNAQLDFVVNSMLKGPDQ